MRAITGTDGINGHFTALGLSDGFFQGDGAGIVFAVAYYHQNARNRLNLRPVQ